MGPPSASGRWSLLPARAEDRTRRAHAAAEQLLTRHGVLTRNAVVAERATGGFAATYQVLKAMEEAGRCRRGYFVEGLGGAQFAVPGAVDRMRALASDARSSTALVLAATDPANPFGAALPWPSGETDRRHRPGRKAGASVVLVDGSLALYLEKGGRTLLTFASDTELALAVVAVGDAVRAGTLGTVSVERIDGQPCPASGPLIDLLAGTGFVPTSKGMRLRTGPRQ
jgi:ATP-dependent Lhr-like helicase